MDIQKYHSIINSIPSRARTYKHIKNLYPELGAYLEQTFDFCGSFPEKLYCFLNDIHQVPVCGICGKPVTFINQTLGYHKFCSVKCGSIGSLDKKRETKLERYGDPNYNNSGKLRQTVSGRTDEERQRIREKTKKTCLQKYGVEHPSKSDTIKNKTRYTYASRTEEQRRQTVEQTKRTKMERYDNPTYNNRQKAMDTCMDHYGVSNPFKSEVIKDKIIHTMNERYGVDYAQQSSDIQETTRKNNMVKYGVDHPMKDPKIKERTLDAQRQIYINNDDDLLGYSEDNQMIRKCPHLDCNLCTDKFYFITSTQYTGRKHFDIEPCTRIMPISQGHPKNTTLELFIHNILDKYHIYYETNNRTILNGKELDIYIPDRGVAIECNGCFWHSVYNKPASYHIDKWVACKNNNIQLITLWEDQIKIKPEVVESILLSKLGIYEHRIGARECTIKVINGKICNGFLENNHIQGRVNGAYHLGLYYGDMLVSVMTFGMKSKLSGSKASASGEWELSRFCNLKYYQVQGAASRLLKYFIEHIKPSIIYSFASNDISNGNLYERLGFKSDNKITGAYWYIGKNDLKRYHRSHFTKRRLHQMGYDILGSTESQIMSSLPYYKIYDCGHTKYTLVVAGDEKYPL